MRRLAYISLYLLMTVSLGAQTLPLSTQFMYNKLTYNPGFAGHYDAAQFTAMARAQWVGFSGAPSTQLASANLPLWDQRIGLGLTLSNHQIGITSRVSVDAAYAYRIPVSEDASVSIGLQTGLGRYMVDFSSPDLVAIDGRPSDPAIPGARLNENLLNLGVGVYFSTEDFYVGLSAPRLTEHNLSDPDASSGTAYRQIFGMIGGALPVGDVWTLQPELLYTYSDQLPWDIDASVSLLYQDRLRLGANYRYGGDSQGWGESVDLIIGLHLTDQLMIGAAYDYPLSQLRTVSSGSIEFILSYGLSSPARRETNPRYF